MGRKRITEPGHLPRTWQVKWQKCAAAYVAQRMYSSRHEAEQAAFEDVRAAYWSQARAALAGDDEPGFDTGEGDPFAE